MTDLSNILVKNFVDRSLDLLDPKYYKEGFYEIKPWNLETVEMHFNILRCYCRSKLIPVPIIKKIYFKFGHWKVVTLDSNLPLGVLALLDDLCIALERNMSKYKK